MLSNTLNVKYQIQESKVSEQLKAANESIVTSIHISQSHITANIMLAMEENAATYTKTAFGFIAAAAEPPEPTTMPPALLVAVASGGSARLATGMPVVCANVCDAVRDDC